MDYLLLIVGFILAAGTTALLMLPLRNLAVRKGWVDKPDGERKLHAAPVPSIGGVAMVAGFGVSLLFLILFQNRLSFEPEWPSMLLWIGVFIITCTGFYDDVHGLGFKPKFLVQTIVAYLLLHAGYRIDVNVIPFVDVDAYQQALYSIPLTLIWVVGIINAVNLIDGLDGLAGGVVMIGLLSLAAIFGLQGNTGLIVFALLLSGAVAGFLYHNFNPASVFMGDTGSLFLGTMLAAYTLQGQMHADSVLSLLVPVVALGLPVLDTNLSIFRRISTGKAICNPDRDHIHHRLVARFASRFAVRRAVLTLYGVAAGFGAVAVCMTLLPHRVALVIVGLTLVLVYLGLRSLGYLRLGSPQLQQVEPGYEEVEVVPAIAAEHRYASGDGATEHVPSILQPTVHKSAITERSIIVAANTLARTELEDENALLGREADQRRGMGEVDTRILNMIERPRPVNDIIATILQEYEVEPETVKPHVLAFLQDMENRRLIRIEEAVDGVAA